MKKNFFLFILLCPLVLYASHSQAQVLVTVAGDSVMGYNGDGIPATSAELQSPESIAVDGLGNLYIGDIANNRIRKVTRDGIISTYGGTGYAGYTGDGGPATNANMNAGYMAADAAGNLYVADPLYNKVRVITTDGNVNVFAGTGTAGFSGDGGAATAAILNNPTGLAVDGAGNVYISDNGNSRVRKVSTGGVITTVAGGGLAVPGDGGAATDAQLFSPGHLTVDASGNVFVLDQNVVRKISAGVITSLLLPPPYSCLGIAASGNNLYVSVIRPSVILMLDSLNHFVRYSGGISAGYAGDGAAATAFGVRYNMPVDIVADASGSLFIADNNNNRVRCIVSTTAAVPATEAAPGVSLFPSPNNGSFHLNVATPAADEVHVRIINYSGQTVEEFSMPANGEKQCSLKAAPGLYFAVINDGSSQKTIPFIIKPTSN